MAHMQLEVSQEHPLLEAYWSLGRKMEGVTEALSEGDCIRRGVGHALDLMEDERSEAPQWDLVHCCLDFFVASMTCNEHSGMRQVDVLYVPTTAL